MFNLKKKTEAEVEKSVKDIDTTSKLYNEKYMMGDTFWHCPTHNVLFEPDDRIIERVLGKEHSAHCLLKVKVTTRNFLSSKTWDRPCLARLTCGDMDYWKKHFHITPSPPSV